MDMADNPVSIVVVDDSDLIRELILDFSELCEVKAVAFGCWTETPPEALWAADALFLDIKMPAVDGLDILAYLEGEEFKKPIVIVSGMEPNILETTVAVGKKHGLNMLGTLAKPFNHKDFSSIINQIKAKKANANTPQKLTPSTSPEPLTISNLAEQFAFKKDDYLRGIEKSEFVPAFQPQINTENGKIDGAECLARWNHPEHGLLSPFHFIPGIELNGLEDKFTIGFIQTTLRQLRDIQSETSLRYSFNLSAKSISYPFVEVLIAVFNEYEITPDRITLEITESSILNASEERIQCITKLRVRGFSISLDDFGTGYSTISNLKDLPVNEVKIDRSFISTLGQSDTNIAIVKSLYTLAHELRLRLVVEGVETREQLDMLLGQGRAIIQGFYFCKPLLISEYLAYLEKEKTAAIIDFEEEREHAQSVPDKNLCIIESPNQLRQSLLLSVGKYFGHSQTLTNSELKTASLEDDDIVLVSPRDAVFSADVLEVFSNHYTVALIEASGSELLVGLQDAGVDEVIHIQLGVTEIAHRLNLSHERYQKEKQQESMLQYSQSAAFEAMREASEYGGILQLTKDMLSVHHDAPLVEKINQFFANLGLKTAVQLRDSRTRQSKGDLGEPELVRQLFALLHDKGRIYNFNQRLMCNASNCSILIKNMPQEETLAGRIRDVVAVVIEILEAKWRDILQRALLDELDDKLHSMSASHHQTVDAIQDDIDDLKSKFSETLYASFHVLDLSEEQEVYLINMMDKLVNEMGTLQRLKDLSSMASDIEHIVKQKHLLQRE